MREQAKRELIGKLFNIPISTPLTKEEAERALEINNIFEALAFRTGIREKELFYCTYLHEDEAHQRLYAFLHNVLGCPPEVIACAEALIEAAHKKEIEKSEAPKV